MNCWSPIFHGINHNLKLSVLIEIYVTISFRSRGLNPFLDQDLRAGDHVTCHGRNYCLGHCK